VPWLYGASAAAGALIIFASTDHFVEALIGGPLLGLGLMCLAVELCRG
jgi:hypothetical protein